jgi:hypothetical protein
MARRGVGANLLVHLERLAVLRNCAYLQMDASVNAEAFYVDMDIKSWSAAFIAWPVAMKWRA